MVGITPALLTYTHTTAYDKKERFSPAKREKEIFKLKSGNKFRVVLVLLLLLLSKGKTKESIFSRTFIRTRRRRVCRFFFLNSASPLAMEEEDAKKIDDVLTALLSMGFELEDSQAAVQSGRLTVESAVEWLLLKKNRPTNSCRLYEVNPALSSGEFVSSEPSSSPPASSRQVEETSVPAAETDKPEETEEENVISRTFVNTKQREIKKKFEEKQRNEAQRLAILERKNQKTARALVLQQIADDREQQKKQFSNTSAVGAAALPASPTAGASTAPVPPVATVATASTEDGEQSSPTSATCNIQIRHPDGQSLRHIFDGSTFLQDIWTYATENFTDTENMCLMQPFPRRDFTKEDAGKTLHELGLCPSVGLVLKKTDGSQQAFGRS